MTGAGKNMGDEPPRAPLADDAYSLSTTRDDEERAAAPDETTGLLDAGDRELSQSSGDEAPPARKDSWVGYEEFEGLPWFKRPSVQLLHRTPETRRAPVLTMSVTRSTGLSLGTPSSLWPLVVP